MPLGEPHLKDELDRGRIDGIVSCDHDVGTRDLNVHCGGGAFLGAWVDSVCDSGNTRPWVDSRSTRAGGCSPPKLIFCRFQEMMLLLHSFFSLGGKGGAASERETSSFFTRMNESEAKAPLNYAASHPRSLRTDNIWGSKILRILTVRVPSSSNPEVCRACPGSDALPNRRDVDSVRDRPFILLLNLPSAVDSCPLTSNLSPHLCVENAETAAKIHGTPSFSPRHAATQSHSLSRFQTMHLLFILGRLHATASMTFEFTTAAQREPRGEGGDWTRSGQGEGGLIEGGH